MTGPTLEFLAALGVAAGASFHCVGMCGPFVLASALSGDVRRAFLRRELPRQLLYHVGKTTTYLFLGALAGASGELLIRAQSELGRPLGILAAIVLFAAGLAGLGRLPGTGAVAGTSLGRTIARAFARFGDEIRSLPPSFRPLALGTLSGFLPCPLVWAFLAAGAARGSAVESVALLLALGLGTAPVLIALAWTGRLVSASARARIARIGAFGLIALALWTGWRAVGRPSCCESGVRLPRDAPAANDPALPAEDPALE